MSETAEQQVGPGTPPRTRGSRAMAHGRRVAQSPALQASALATFSQVLGFIQLVLLLAGRRATGTTDSYFLLFAFQQLPSLILITGYLYPVWLRTRGRFSGEKVARAASVAFVPLSVAGASLWLGLHGRSATVVWIVAGLLTVNGCLVSGITMRASLMAADGDSRWTAALAVPANFCACVALAASFAFSLDVRTIAMCAALCVGNLAYLLVLELPRFAATRDTLPQADVGGLGRLSTVLVSRALIGYGAGNVMQFAATQLPVGAASSFNFVSRVVVSIVNTGLNSVLPRFMHVRTESPASLYRLTRVIALVSIPVSGIALAVASLDHTNLAVYTSFGLAWLTAGMLNAALQRSAYRLLHGRILAIPMFATVGLAATAMWLTRTSHGIAGLLLITVLVDAVSALINGVALKRWVEAASVSLSIGTAIALLFLV